MSKIIISLIGIICLLGNHQVFSQEDKTNNDSITQYSIAYEKLKKLYLKQLDSDIYHRKRSFFHQFYQKMNFDGDKAEIIPNPLPWIEKNLEKTDFFSYKDAELQWKLYMVVNEEEQEKNSDYYNFMFSSMDKFGGKIVTEVMMDIVENYPERFNPTLSPSEIYKD